MERFSTFCTQGVATVAPGCYRKGMDITQNPSPEEAKMTATRNPFDTLRENPFAEDENPGRDWANPQTFATEAEYVAWLDEQMAISAAARDERNHEGRVS
jgi:hypothetical protein